MMDLVNNNVTRIGGVQAVVNGTCNTSVEQMEVIKTNICGSGGFAAAMIDEATMAAMREACANRPEALETLNQMGLEPTVFVEGYVAQFLSEEELEAVVNHELAHVQLGHLKEGVECEYSQRNELEADAVGAQRVSKKAMRGALVKIAKVVASVREKGTISLDGVSKVQFAKEFQERLDALA